MRSYELRVEANPRHLDLPTVTTPQGRVGRLDAARCSTDEQDLTAQRIRLAELGVPEERVYLDHGLTGGGWVWASRR